MTFIFTLFFTLKVEAAAALETSKKLHAITSPKTVTFSTIIFTLNVMALYKVTLGIDPTPQNFAGQHVCVFHATKCEGTRKDTL